MLEDVDAILELWVVAAENDSRPADNRDLVVTLLERDPAALLVALSGEEIVGSIVAGWDGWRAHLYRLAVLPAYRRMGIGRSLLAAVEDRLSALGAHRYDAMVLDENKLAHTAWSAAGYRRQSGWGRWIKPM